MHPEVLVPFLFFAFLAAVILVPILAKERTRRSAHDLISQAMARGQTLDPALVAKLSEDILQEGNRARKSLGSGVVLLALAVGFVAAGFVIDGFDHDGDVIRGMAVPAVMLGSVGLAFILPVLLDYATTQREA